MNIYATVEEIREYLGHPDDLVDDDQRLMRFASSASRVFDSFTSRKFYPRYDAIGYDHPDGSSTILLDEDLLEVSSITTNNTGTTLTSSEYFLMHGHQYDKTPYNTLCTNTETTEFTWSGTRQRANVVTGIWGFREDWANAWGDSGDTVQDNPLLSSATSLTVSDADSTDERGFSPRFQAGQLIRFGSASTAEYAHITDVVGDTLTIKREVNGSTVADQAQSTVIYIYRPQDDIYHAMLTLASHMYRRKDSIGSQDDRPLASPSGVVIMPNQLPSEVKSLLSKYKRWWT